MRKRVIAKGNLRRGDRYRAIVTDTLPEEVPIVFSNAGFYKNLQRFDKLPPEFAEFVKSILKAARQYTIPYRYNVLLEQFSIRRLSLIHPAAQVQVADFYGEHDELICFYASRSEASVRSPRKVGSTFFVKGTLSDLNKYRRGGVDTVGIETSVSNPASYFSYYRYRRAHEFFDSMDYIHLEKKYTVFRTLDVSKCFSSIYTHTLFWATADIKTAKDNASAKSFANDFDVLVRSMNYNETNGICVGPEVSRVFAELIFSEIDRCAIRQLADGGLVFRTNYEFRRYVDDFYVFAQNAETMEKVTSAIRANLMRYNLHINEKKTTTISRPFVTRMSRVISDTNKHLSAFLDRVISYQLVDNKELVAYPKKIYRSDAILRKLVNGIKTTCLDHDAGYQSVSDYIISAVTQRIISLSDGYEVGSILESVKDDDYSNAFHLLLEATFFFYTVNPTVRSSLNLAHSIVVASELFRSRLPERLPFLAESIIRWTIDLIKSIHAGSRHKDLGAIPIEVLNAVLALSEAIGSDALLDDMIAGLCDGIEEFEYFEMVSFLYILKDKRDFRALATKVFVRAKELVKESEGLRVDAQAAVLALDILSCPYLPLNKRASWFNTLRRSMGLQGLSAVDAQAAIRAAEAFPWFVEWRGVDLLTILKKKELSAVY